MTVKKILVPIDYSDHSYRALQWGVSLAEKYGAQMLLLHVLPKAVEEVSTHAAGWADVPGYYYEGEASGQRPFQSEHIVIDLVAQAQGELYDLIRKEIKETVPVAVKVAVGKPAEEILQVAREEVADLIVMGTHGRTGLRHMLLGSVAESLVRTAPCPVFTVRAGPTAES